MHVTGYSNSSEFAERVTPLLVRREAENCFILGRLSEFSTGTAPPADSLMLSIEEAPADPPVAAAMMVAPQPLVLTRAGPDVIDAVVAHLVRAGRRPRAVSSVDETARALAAAWSAAAGAVARSELATGLFQLTRVIPPRRPATGIFRPAMEADQEWLINWANQFFTEIGHFSPPDIPGVVAARIREGRLFLWCDPAGRPVSMAGWAGRTPRGVRVNFVYTPTEYRGRGYATACVATLSQHLLDAGHEFCFLFTDLSNPTSNRIYRAIGYEHVCDLLDVRFE